MRNPLFQEQNSSVDRMRPTNVRELHNALERAVLVSEGSPWVEVGGIFAAEQRIWGAQRAGGRRFRRRESPLRDVERELVIEALEPTGYVQKDAAELLRVSRRKLNYMIRRMGITLPSWRLNRQLDRDEPNPEADVSGGETP